MHSNFSSLRLFRTSTLTLTAALIVSAASTALGQYYDSDGREPFLPNPVRTVSTIPVTGDADLNPYGVAFIGENFRYGTGPLRHGDILVSNFNGPQNLQGTGTSIVRVPASGAPTVFFRSTGGQTGLSTGLTVLNKGLILVCSLPTVDGTAATASFGSLLVLDANGNQLQSFTGNYIQGPWDMATVDLGDYASVFISNAMTGSITRLNFKVNPTGLVLIEEKTIASGFTHRADPAALFITPTGLVYDATRDTLYIASSGDNAVFAVNNPIYRSQDAQTGHLIYQDNVHLHGALAMAQAPNGDLLVSNNDVINVDPNQPSEIVEFTRDGRFVKELPVDPNLGGAFGLAVHGKHNGGATFAAVDDNASTLTIWQLSPQ